ncbi:hypothetical protein P5G65_04795 [Paenibacillus chondroitinus]|uniref:Uncharacterized protein n=1 Tax=Paenibacillus chondroitinus TaxID=59842 RepID=A0ABU6D8F8_9BACL|nr:hypothetical protein [Paenibacillus chondroitinus]MEB4793203.1 hypothetical protein [Paenibacillus chondroitinus]
MTIIFEIAYTYKWWTIHERIVPWGYIIDVSFVYGLFAVGTVWIFYLTFRKFWIYVLTNLVIDAFFSFLGLHWLVEGMGVATIHIAKWIIFVLFFSLSFVIYGYQVWQEKVFVPLSSNHLNEMSFRLPRHSKIKEKAK